jgi:hypothetical protein
VPRVMSTVVPINSEIKGVIRVNFIQFMKISYSDT